LQEHDRGLESGDRWGSGRRKKYVDQLKSRPARCPGDAYRPVPAGRGIPVEVGFFVFEFMGGSMGSVVARRSRASSSAPSRTVARRSCSARRAVPACRRACCADADGQDLRARSKLREPGSRTSRCCLHPTTGGVAASVAMLGDVDHRRARCPDRLRRSPRDRADDPPAAPAGLPAARVPARARHGRHVVSPQGT